MELPNVINAGAATAAAAAAAANSAVAGRPAAHFVV